MIVSSFADSLKRFRQRLRGSHQMIRDKQEAIPEDWLQPVEIAALRAFTYRLQFMAVWRIMIVYFHCLVWQDRGSALREILSQGASGGSELGCLRYSLEGGPGLEQGCWGPNLAPVGLGGPP